MAKQELNFRYSLAYRSDDSADTYVVESGDTYPITTPQGFDVGWVDPASVAAANRTTGGDPRLGGSHRQFWSAATAVFRVELPAVGSYDIRVAVGDQNFTHYGKLQLYDNTTLVTTLVDHDSLTSGNFADATNAVHTAANWPGNNSAYTHNFSSTIAEFHLANSGFSTGNRFLAHISIESSGGAAALEGDAAAQVSVVGSLTTSIPLTGASVVVATANGSLNVPVSLAGDAASISAASASLATQILVAGDASGSSAASGDLSTGISLSSDAATQSTATADLTATITMSGAAVAQALANAGIDTSILLGGHAAGQISATGALDSDSNIAGNAAASASATGDLDTAISMVGAAQGSSNATGWIVKAGGTLDDLHDSMGNNAAGVALENNPTADWTTKGIVGMGNRGRGPATPTAWAPADTSYKTLDPWTACVAWFVIWPGVNHAANNTGVNIKNIEFWVKRISNGQWYLANSGNTMPDWPSPASGVSYRVEADGSRSYFLDGARNSNGVAIHGGTARFAIDGDDIACVYARLETRLVLDDAAGQNDMADAELFCDAGADYWPDMTSVIGDFAPMTYMPAVGNSRFERVLASPRITQFATIDPPGDNGGYTFVGARSITRAAFEAELPPTLMPFAADAAAQADATGEMTTDIPLEADAAGQSAATGDIGGAAQLAGVANAAATATGNLTIQIQLSAAAVAQVLASGSLDNPVNLTGQVSSNATAAGDLTTQISMGANAQSIATATGALASTAIPLAGNAAATATGQGDLDTAIRLDGAALNLVSGTGDLTVNLGISGDAAALVAAGADLTTQIPLNAQAVAQVLAAANLSGGQSTIKPSKPYTVKGLWRDYHAAA